MNTPRNARRRLLRVAALAVATVPLLAACDIASQTDTLGEDWRDVRVGSRDDSPAHIIHMPNGYSNAAFKCNGGTGVYVTMNGNGRALAVAPNDPACAR